MAHSRRRLAFAAIALGFVLPAQAGQAPGPTPSVPRVVRLDGQLTPANGLPPSALETVTVAIYASATDSSPLWEETQEVRVDPQGRYTVFVGGATTDGLPLSVLTGETRWLGVRVARPAEVEQPRVPLTSVPYALRASDAGTLGGLPPSAFLRAAGTGGAAPASTPGGGPATQAAPAVSSGTPNYIGKFTNAVDLTSSIMYDSGGRIGVGTAAPLDILHSQFTDTSGTVTGLAVQNLGSGAGAYSGMLFYDQNGNLGQFQGFNNTSHEYRINNIAAGGSINFMLGSSSKFAVASSGNIGIGTTSPSAMLEVSNAIAGVPANVWVTSYSNAVGPYFLARRARGTSAAPTAVLSGDLLAGIYGRGYGTTGFSTTFSGMAVQAAQTWTDAAQGTRLAFVTTPLGTTAPLLQMLLDGSGNLGVGTLTPSGSLEVVRDSGRGGATQVLTSYAGASSSGESNVELRVARGTIAAPSAVQLGDELGAVGFNGYATTGWGGFGAGIGAFAAENWTDAAQGTVLGLATTALGANEADIKVIVLPSGNTGIGLAISGIPTIVDRLEVSGDVRVGTSGNNGCLKNFAGTGLIGTCSSDRRFKKDITAFGPVLDRLTALQPVHYFWRAAEFPERKFGETQAYGLIAQDVETVLPELVQTERDGYKAVDYTKLPLLTIQAMKELKAEKDALQQRVEQLERLVAGLTSAGRR